MFARHLPPSAGLPRVLALDSPTAASLSRSAQVIQAQAGPDLHGAPGSPGAPGVYDAVAGFAAPQRLPALFNLLRPGGRLILAAVAQPEQLLAALEAAGCIHCLVEPVQAPGQRTAGLMLYRGERPPHADSLVRHQTLAADQVRQTAPPEVLAGYQAIPSRLRHLFLLISQSPNKPAWRLAPGDKLAWHAATLLVPGSERPHLLVFSSLVKAVALMQPAILAGNLPGINKVGKFPVSAARRWPGPMVLNVAFDALRRAQPGPPIQVDPRAAITGEE